MIGLLDTSGLIWIERAPDEALELAAHILAGDIAVCEPVCLEVLRGTRSTDEYDERARDLAGLRLVETTSGVLTRARSIQRDLVRLPGPRHRTVPVFDLLIAAAAIEAELPILHRDRDFEAIAEVTGQPQRWVGPRA